MKVELEKLRQFDSYEAINYEGYIFVWAPSYLSFEGFFLKFWGVGRFGENDRLDDDFNQQFLYISSNYLNRCHSFSKCVGLLSGSSLVHFILFPNLVSNYLTVAIKNSLGSSFVII